MNTISTYINRLIPLVTMALVFGAHSSTAKTDEERGLEIALEVDLHDTGFGDTKAELEMYLENRHGEFSSRKMGMQTLEVEGDGDKTLISFDYPLDVKGTAFLSFTHKEGDDDQWLYLPALKRIKRIASNNKSGPFVGSEFAYEDLSSQEVEKYTYKFIEKTVFNGVDHWLIERYPLDRKSGYTRQQLWVDQERYIVTKIDFYDRKNSLLKTLDFMDYRQYLDKFWRADKMVMVNHQTGKSTALKWTDYVFGNGYTDRDFDQRSLKNAR